MNNSGVFGIQEKHKEGLSKIMNRLHSPFFFYDLDSLEAHLGNLKKLSPEWLKLWYACKANPMSGILKLVRNLGLGLDVASQGELDQALRSGVPASMILSTGPAKSKEYMRSLLENEVRVVVAESLNQTSWLNQVAKEVGVRPKVLLRVQLGWEAGHSVLGGDSITPFGIEPLEWTKLKQEDRDQLDIVGLHVFQWGNILDLNKLKTIWDKIFETLTKLANDLNIPLDVIDLGGGLGIPYQGQSPDLTPDFSKIVTMLEEFRKRYQVKDIWMELGRYAVGESGHYFARVIDRKNVRGKDLLVLEGGINHLARGALTSQSFPASLFRTSDALKKEFQVHGPLCTALDILGTYSLPEDILIGDWICFHQAGAYGFTEAMPFFLCHSLPAEVTLYKNSFMTPRTSKTSADWMV